MPTPFPSRQTANSSWSTGTKTKPSTTLNADWRCTQCRKLLGVIEGGGLHLRFSQGHEYFVSLPATANCRGCRTLNRKCAPVLAEASQPDAA
jgi:hypothetical protein